MQLQVKRIPVTRREVTVTLEDAEVDRFVEVLTYFSTWREYQQSRSADTLKLATEILRRLREREEDHATP